MAAKKVKFSGVGKTCLPFYSGHKKKIKTKAKTKVKFKFYSNFALCKTFFPPRFLTAHQNVKNYVIILK